MPIFNYKGRDKKGNSVEGQVDAISEISVAQKLSRVDVIPIKIKQATKEDDVFEYIAESLNIGKPLLEDLSMFARQMYTMTKSGVPLIRSIKVIKDATKSRGLRNALNNIIISLESGYSLANCFKQHPIIFNNLFVSMIEVGETTGNLDAAFLQIAIYLDKEIETRKKIKTASRYPLMVCTAIIVATAIINIFVIPSFKGFFKSFGSELPIQTRILIATSDFAVNYWFYILLLLAASIFFISLYINSNKGKLKWDYFKLKIPLIGSILQRALLARFCRSFAMTTKAGVPLLEAINVIAGAVDNKFVGNKILEMRTNLEKGEALSIAASNTGLFTPLVLQMLTIGEETGDIDSMLLQVSEYYEREVEYDLKKLADSIEPLLIVIIAGFVLVLALGVFLPMWDMSSVAMKSMRH